MSILNRHEYVDYNIPNYIILGMGMKSYTRGKIAEKLAIKYVEKLGYSLVCSNWACPYGELDIVGQIGDKITFFEVKYRSSDKYGTVFDAFNAKKIKKLRKTINCFFQQYNYFYSSYGLTWTLDGLCIFPSQKERGKFNLEHISNILDT